MRETTGSPITAAAVHPAGSSDLTGQVAVVTGGGGGIGAATARCLAAFGAAVVVCDIAVEKGREVAEALAAAGAEAQFVHVDVAAEPDWTNLRQFIGERITILVNNAGVGRRHDVEEETAEGWNAGISVNQTGVFFGMKHIGGVMAAAGRGTIVNVSSMFSAVGGVGNAIAYHASKAAVESMTRNVAVRWAARGVRVNSVHPGFVATEMTLRGLTPEAEQAYLAATPMGRLGQPEEVAQVIAFLASPRSSFMTGAAVFVDGGYTCR